MMKTKQNALAIFLYTLFCFTRTNGAEDQNSLGMLASFGGSPPASKLPLGLCKGDCDNDSHCRGELICFQRDRNEPIPGCHGRDTTQTDYCVDPNAVNDRHREDPTSKPTAEPTSKPTVNHVPISISKPTANSAENSLGILASFGASPPASMFPLGLCEGDCDKDSHCKGGLKCFQRGSDVPIPGCIGTDDTPTDYCINPNAINNPDFGYNDATEYTPGKLAVDKTGLLLSEGLDARVIATSNQYVPYADGGESSIPFHDRPDAGATFPDDRSHNEGGWVYVSNSEMRGNGEGGVGALTFDKDGNVLDYETILEGTTMNCGGGHTPWMTWVSCEEVKGGHIYQVDPSGVREAQKMTLGSDGGHWESFAYDIRDQSKPRFFATEDVIEGALRRFTPESPDWNQPWDILHGPGNTDFLMITPNATNDGGTFVWTDDKNAAKENAKAYYPNTEGIDILDSQLFFVSKGIKQIFTLNLDQRTYSNQTTAHGLFDGAPDTIARILQDPTTLLYFTEEGGVDAGVHARDHLGRFYTIFESPVYIDETTGLSFSPDGRFMYVAYQENGLLFTIWRRDGLGFHEAQLDIKFHATVS